MELKQLKDENEVLFSYISEAVELHYKERLEKLKNERDFFKYEVTSLNKKIEDTERRLQSAENALIHRSQVSMCYRKEILKLRSALIEINQKVLHGNKET